MFLNTLCVRRNHLLTYLLTYSITIYFDLEVSHPCVLFQHYFTWIISIIM